ncbi:ankyrin repeat domain-containing protein [Rickettsiales endosymbiont of Stachyamoeba lipophora]|uniref:ankyrin repeat domain-containing protein n=1 Tax=Rickettsiales endosymbiont of Stachyamoeba lipophora TaxID=2486578 RepID=UPI000F6458C5|nr:ankyrin repeat domain-containing protein [Rickettsiales endosymbiont of Stachyamoeba lipophora]AZL15395.1 ankyrin repeat domain-containing protein [Rickettsiales endosymbiont of Stachyamoeba lipophora]
MPVLHNIFTNIGQAVSDSIEVAINKFYSSSTKNIKPALLQPIMPAAIEAKTLQRASTEQKISCLNEIPLSKAYAALEYYYLIKIKKHPTFSLTTQEDIILELKKIDQPHYQVQDFIYHCIDLIGKDRQDDNKYTLLHHAAFNNNLQLTELLLTMDANSNILACNNYTPLHLALVNCKIELVKYTKFCHKIQDHPAEYSKDKLEHTKSNLDDTLKLVLLLSKHTNIDPLLEGPLISSLPEENLASTDQASPSKPRLQAGPVSINSFLKSLSAAECLTVEHQSMLTEIENNIIQGHNLPNCDHNARAPLSQTGRLLQENNSTIITKI